MVVVKLIGGLGNQMFQYALGYHLSIRNSASLYLDVSELLERENSIHKVVRDFELDIFNVKYRIKKPATLPTIFIKFYKQIFPIQHIQELTPTFKSEILQLKGGLYLNGFWQTEKYFKDIEAELRQHFTFKMKPDEINKLVIDKIKSTNSIAIHFRRGDYITNPQANNFHGVCPDDYYRNAISKVKEKVSKPHFFIFSDDIDWVKQSFTFKDDHTYIDFNKGKKSFEDLRLMTFCKHNIIANSSFSWWGAWLNSNKNKIVIAPQQWFKTVQTDIVPAEWTQI